MPTVGMVGQNGREMAHELLRMNEGGARCFHITPEKPLAPELDMLVVSEALPVLAQAIETLSPEGYLVVNSDDKEIFAYLPQGAKLITYGLNSKACITASSITDDGLQVCIQRAFTGLGGNMCDPQEFPVKLSSSTELALGAAAAWIVL